MTLATLADSMDEAAALIADESPWFLALARFLRTLDAETKANGIQHAERWRLMLDLLKAGAHAYWVFAQVAGNMRDVMDLSRLALRQERAYEQILDLLNPEIIVRQPADISPLLTNLYGTLAAAELLSTRAREDLTYLTRDPLLLSASHARLIIARLPAGVLAWQ